MIYPVKYFHSQMRGAPVLSGTAGSLIALLDAVFTTGFGLVTAQSVTVSDGIATATLAQGQSFEEHAVVLVEGATPAALNGEARVLPDATSTQIQWATAAADGVATGSITLKTAPASWWTKVYAGVNKAAYKSTDLLANGHLLRVDDTGTTAARVVGYESMSDVDTGIGPFPHPVDQVSGGGYWWKSVNANAVRYKLFIDSRVVLIAIAAGSSGNASYVVAPMRGFGDPLALRPAGDVWGTFLCASGSTTYIQHAPLDGYNASSWQYGFAAVPRSWTGLGGSEACSPLTFSGASSAYSGADATLGAFPSVIDGELKLSKMFLSTGGLSTPRAIVPGVYRIAQSGALSVLADGSAVAAIGALQGRRLIAIATGADYSSTAQGVYLVDSTGPWR
jgi:hypothetical protein